MSSVLPFALTLPDGLDALRFDLVADTLVMHTTEDHIRRGVYGVVVEVCAQSTLVVWEPDHVIGQTSMVANATLLNIERAATRENIDELNNMTVDERRMYFAPRLNIWRVMERARQREEEIARRQRDEEIARERLVERRASAAARRREVTPATRRVVPRLTATVPPRFTKEGLDFAQATLFEMQDQVPEGAYVTLMDLILFKNRELERA